MQYTTIPGTDMQASRICLGTMTFGSPVAGPDAARLVRYALEEHGVNFIDTANMYEGYNRYAGSAGGVAEEIVGEAEPDQLAHAPPGLEQIGIMPQYGHFTGTPRRDGIRPRLESRQRAQDVCEPAVRVR